MDEINEVKKVKEPIATINNSIYVIRRAFQLKDGRIISCSDDGTILIYKLYSITEVDIQITLELSIVDIKEIEQKKLIACSTVIQLIKLEEKKGEVIQTLYSHDDHHWINRIIKLSNGLIATCGDDKKIIFYKYNKVLVVNDKITINLNLISFFECNLNELMVFGYNVHSKKITLVFYNINNKQEITRIIDNREIYFVYDLQSANYEIINNKFLAVGLQQKIIFINLINHSIYKIINLKYDYFITNILILNNNKLLCSDNIGNIYEFNIENIEYIILKDVFKAHNNLICYLSKFQEDKIISSSRDSSLKIWKLT